MDKCETWTAWHSDTPKQFELNEKYLYLMLKVMTLRYQLYRHDYGLDSDTEQKIVHFFAAISLFHQKGKNINFLVETCPWALHEKLYIKNCFSPDKFNHHTNYLREKQAEIFKLFSEE